MHSDFVFFGPAHWAIFATIPAVAALLTWPALHRPRLARWLRLGLGWFLLANELTWYFYKYSTEGNRLPEGLPLQLCDLSLWLTILTLFRLRPATFEPAWYVGIAGAAMAVITPELWAPALSYPTAYFFVAHGGIIVAMLFLVWSHQARPTRRGLLRALLVLNAWALLVGAFNALFHTNYMYLCRKPVSASLLDSMGPWPWYLLGGELAAAALFALLALPFPGRPPSDR